MTDAPFKPGSVIERAHPEIAALSRKRKITTMEFRVMALKAGVKVLKRTEMHLCRWPKFWSEQPSIQVAVTDAIASCRYRRSLLQAELEGLKY